MHPGTQPRIGDWHTFEELKALHDKGMRFPSKREGFG
jgi:hypothetical protein